MNRIRFYLFDRVYRAFIVRSILLSLMIIGSNVYLFSNYFTAVKVSSNSFDSEWTNSGAALPGAGILAIIIDDFGQNREGVKEMMSIPAHLTFAVMPFLAFTYSDSHSAHEKGYEIIVHLPMEAYSGKLSWVGPRPILSVMNDMEIRQTVKECFESVPFAVGANIHMGSKVGDDTRVISDVLEIISEKKPLFCGQPCQQTPCRQGHCQ